MNGPRGPGPTRPGRIIAWLLRRGWIAVMAVGIAYLGILAFPDVLFAHRMTRGNFRVASDAPIDPGIARVLDRARMRLGASAIDDPEMTHRIYLCSSPWRKAMLCPTGRGAFGSTPMVFGYTVLLGRADIAGDRIERGSSRTVRRSLSRVIAHERTHALINGHLGLRGSRRCPPWIKEGYCDYVAGETSFPIAEAKRLIRDGREAGDPAFQYARAYLTVKYLIEVEALGVDRLLRLRIGQDDLAEDVGRELDRL